MLNVCPNCQTQTLADVPGKPSLSETEVVTGSSCISTQVIDISKELSETHIPDLSELLDQVPDREEKVSEFVWEQFGYGFGGKQKNFARSLYVNV